MKNVMKMKTMGLMGLTLFFGMSQTSFAEGWVCQSNDLVVKVYHYVQPDFGTRNVAVMVLSDPVVARGRKTIARFTDVNHTLSNTGARYEANVDLRFTDSSRSGERIGGTRLGELDTILLDIDFSYAAPIANGATASAELTLVKRNGKKIYQDLNCERYIKQ